MGADGRETSTGRRMPVFSLATLSPDGRRVAFTRAYGGTMQVVVTDLASGADQRLSATGMNWAPIWHPDGRRVAFITMRKGDFDVMSQPVDGSPEEVIESSDIDESPEAWLPDGRLVLKTWQADGTTSILLLDPARSARTPLVTGTFGKESSDVSPDGRWLAIVANPSGAYQVHVRSLSGSGGFQQISSGDVASIGGIHWAPNGLRLFYLRRWELVAATLVQRDGTLVTETQQVIARVPRGSTIVGVSPDGKRTLHREAGRQLVSNPTRCASRRQQPDR